MTETKTENFVFQAEVSRLLDIVVHALYSQKDIFLRELISNAADACDKLRYAALTDATLASTLAQAKYAIHLIADKDKNTLTVADNGIGMNHDDMVENLGTIARSGTKAFLEKLGADAKKDISLIGQFGVGFYSAFMVADRVEVISRKAGSAEAWRWLSEGKGSFTIEPASKNLPGTDVILHLKADAAEFTGVECLRDTVKAYSDHIPLPIYFGEDEGEQLNRASALWMRSKAEVKPEEYKEFYHHVGHAFDEPALTLHWRAEGVLEYTGLLFVPTQRPHDLFDPRRQNHVKLYVKRVFIAEATEGLLPPYLRFLRGVIDSEDLPLNISREMLQHNPVLAKMKSGITKRVLSELVKFSENAEAYATFWEQFGATLKEGLYEDFDHRSELQKLFRAKSSKEAGLVSFEEYVGRMLPEQDAVYYITGENAESLARSPQLEGFKARGIEVLLLTDAIDDFWVGAITNYNGKPFKSVTRGDNNLDKIKSAEKPASTPAADAQAHKLIAALKAIYGDAVKDVRVSARLTDSPVCLVADEGEMDMHLEKLLRQNKALNFSPKRVLEINAAHALIQKMAGMVGEGSQAPETVKDLAMLLLDQARLLEGETLADPQAFSQRLTRLGLKAAA